MALADYLLRSKDPTEAIFSYLYADKKRATPSYRRYTKKKEEKPKDEVKEVPETKIEAPETSAYEAPAYDPLAFKAPTIAGTSGMEMGTTVPDITPKMDIALTGTPGMEMGTTAPDLGTYQAPKVDIGPAPKVELEPLPSMELGGIKGIDTGIEPVDYTLPDYTFPEIGGIDTGIKPPDYTLDYTPPDIGLGGVDIGKMFEGVTPPDVGLGGIGLDLGELVKTPIHLGEWGEVAKEVAPGLGFEKGQVTFKPTLEQQLNVGGAFADVLGRAPVEPVSQLGGMLGGVIGGAQNVLGAISNVTGAIAPVVGAVGMIKVGKEIGEKIAYSLISPMIPVITGTMKAVGRAGKAAIETGAAILARETGRATGEFLTGQVKNLATALQAGVPAMVAFTRKLGDPSGSRAIMEKEKYMTNQLKWKEAIPDNQKWRLAGQTADVLQGSKTSELSSFAAMADKQLDPEMKKALYYTMLQKNPNKEEYKRQLEEQMSKTVTPDYLAQNKEKWFADVDKGYAKMRKDLGMPEKTMDEINMTEGAFAGQGTADLKSRLGKMEGYAKTRPTDRRLRSETSTIRKEVEIREAGQQIATKFTDWSNTINNGTREERQALVKELDKKSKWGKALERYYPEAGENIDKWRTQYNKYEGEVVEAEKLAISKQKEYEKQQADRIAKEKKEALDPIIKWAQKRKRKKKNLDFGALRERQRIETEKAAKKKPIQPAGTRIFSGKEDFSKFLAEQARKAQERGKEMAQKMAAKKLSQLLGG